MSRHKLQSEPTPSAAPRASERGVTQGSGRQRAGSGAGAFDARTIARAAARCAVVTDSENRIVGWNRVAVELLGLTTEQAEGRDLQQVLDARDVFGNRLSAGHSALHEMAREGEAPESFELDVRMASGARLRVAVSVVVVLGPDPGRHELVYLMTPVRRRRRADEAIERILAERPELVPFEPGERVDVGPVITPRQRQVLRLLASGRHAREIADELSISVHTVRSHVRNILDELEAANQVEAVARAVRDRLI